MFLGRGLLLRALGVQAGGHFFGVAGVVEPNEAPNTLPLAGWVECDSASYPVLRKPKSGETSSQS